MFRILALGEGWSAVDERTSAQGADSQNFFFISQLCLSISAPLLFSRLLFLSQIDDTLGPMTQVHRSNTNLDWWMLCPVFQRADSGKNNRTASSAHCQVRLAPAQSSYNLKALMHCFVLTGDLGHDVPLGAVYSFSPCGYG